MEQAKLSQRELDIIVMVAEGLSGKQIGERLGIAEGTVKSYRYTLGLKTGAHTGPEVTRYAFDQGLIKPRVKIAGA